MASAANELANTLCELLEWKRPNGRLKNRECLELLSQLEGKGILSLPGKRQEGNIASRNRMANERHGAQVKTILVYPLVKNAVRRLRQGR